MLALLLSCPHKIWRNELGVAHSLPVREGVQPPLFLSCTESVLLKRKGLIWRWLPCTYGHGEEVANNLFIRRRGHEREEVVSIGQRASINGSGPLSAYDLLANPFAVIGVSMRATRAKISDTIEDALFANDTPFRQRELDNARQALVTPRARLEAEIGFLPASDDETVVEVLASLRNGKPAQSADLLTGFDRVNYLAHRCGAGNAEAKARTEKSLVYAYDDVTLTRLVADIIAIRKESGFGAVDDDAARVAFNNIRERHADAALDGFLAVPEGPEAVADLAGELSGPNSGRREFLALLINQYEARMGPEIEQAAADVLEALENLDGAQNDGDLQAFDVALKKWDRLAQPLQVADNARGIDEPHSKDLFRSIRDHCLDLGNNKSQYALAMSISNIGKHVFAELPDAASLIDQDIEALIGLLKQENIEKDLAPLKSRVEAAETDLASLGREFRKSRGSQHSAALLAELDAALSSDNNEVADIAIAMVRGLAIKLANEIDDNEGALAITDALLKRQGSLSSATMARLENDRDVLKGNVEASKIKPITPAPSLYTINGCGVTLYGRTDQKSDGSYIATYYFVMLFVPIFPISRYRVMSEDGRRYRFLSKAPLRKFDIWHLVISLAIIAIFAISISDSSGGGTYSSASYVQQEPVEPPMDLASESASDVSSINVPTLPTAAPPEVADAGEESTPPLYSSGVAFDRPQVRYCMMQKARLQAAKDVTTEPTEDQVQRFNSAVEDYNSRCSDFRYRDSDMTAVETEVSEQASKLRAQGEALVNGGN